jgi:predicted methyltransferase
MRSTRIVAALSLALIVSPMPSSAMAQVKSVAAALTSPDRKPDNVKLDAGRKPTAVLQFLGLKPGMQVLDLFGANGYWAEIMVPAIGPKGHDTIWQPTQFYGARGKAYMEGFVAKHSNANIVASPFEAPDLPKNYADFVILNNNYHDTYWVNEQFKIPQIRPYCMNVVASFPRSPNGSPIRCKQL